MILNLIGNNQGSAPTGTIDITSNGVYNVAPYASANVNVPSSASKPTSDVNFFDYDGTVVESYTADEFSALPAMPNNPSHTGLIAQGWNWSLSDAKTHVATFGKLNIGQMYVTASGKTEIDILIQNDARMSPYLGIAVDGTVEIDWGDNSTDTVTGTSLTTQVRTRHDYAAVGNYTITISVQSGEFTFLGGIPILSNNTNNTNGSKEVYANMILAIRIGNGITSMGNSGITNASSLVYITIPNTITKIGNYTFSYCKMLRSATLPNNVISYGTNIFQGCFSLKSVALPSNITSIGSTVFGGCYILDSITIPNGVTSIGSYGFSNARLVNIIIPNSVTNIDANAFSGCSNLANVTLPNNITAINNGTFELCNGLASITIPSSVTSIGATAFSNCYGMKEYHFLSATPPTLANTNAFNNMPPDCVIYVPAESLSAYQAATNWHSYASKMVGE